MGNGSRCANRTILQLELLFSLRTDLNRLFHTIFLFVRLKSALWNRTRGRRRRCALSSAAPHMLRADKNFILWLPPNWKSNLHLAAPLGAQLSKQQLLRLDKHRPSVRSRAAAFRRSRAPMWISYGFPLGPLQYAVSVNHGWCFKHVKLRKAENRLSLSKHSTIGGMFRAISQMLKPYF